MPLGREPWASGYGSRLMFKRMWVKIPALAIGWTFFKLICGKIVCFKRSKRNEKEAGDWPFLRIFASRNPIMHLKSSLIKFKVLNDDDDVWVETLLPSHCQFSMNEN